jgi:DNA-binding NarL/FixJ family response regulator
VPAPRLQLTEREQDIASLVALGHTNAYIAGQLGIAEQTVRHTLTRIYRKAGVPNRTALARMILAPHKRRSRPTPQA